jgi:hypothetical protein
MASRMNLLFKECGWSDEEGIRQGYASVSSGVEA